MSISFKISQKNIKKKLDTVKEIIRTSHKKTIDSSSKYIVNVIKENIVKSKKTRDKHPFNIYMRSYYDNTFSIRDLVNVVETVEGHVKVGFNNLTPLQKSIVLRQEFGIPIKVTDGIRKLYLAAVAESNSQSNTSRLKPLSSSTSELQVPERRFLRDSFREFGNENILSNQLRFNLNNTIRDFSL